MEVGLAVFNGVSPENLIKGLKKHSITHTFIKSNHPEFEKMMELFAENGITCDNLHAPYKNINHMWSEDETLGSAMLAELTDSVDKCQKYGIPTTIVHLSSGRPMPEITPQGVARYEYLFNYAKEKGVKIALENLRYAENLAYFMDNYPDCVYCWDCGHEYAYTHGKYLPKYGHRLAALHLHDNRCGVDTDDHILPFEGAIPMDEVAKDLAKSGYTGTLMLEIGRLIDTHTYDEMSEEDYMDRAAAAAYRLNDLVEAYQRSFDMRKYENLQCLHENTLPPREHYIPYDSLEKALAGDKTKSAYYKCLNGTWDFRYFSRDIDCPKKIDTWESINVPGCWQSQGYEKPYYTNQLYPYPIDPPFVPDDNPVGVYHRTIVLTEEEAYRAQYLNFEGVSSCFEVFINGNYLGYSSVSRCTSEFSVKMRAGINDLVVKVYKWNVGSYLEDQDCFRYNGIFRNVYLLLRPWGHLNRLDLGYGEKEVNCPHPYHLYDAEGKLFEGEPVLWNAENPYLYTLVIEKNGEFIPVKVGFRTQSVSEKGELLINGVPVKLKGVNHHDTDPDNGYTQTEEQLRAELLKMKELNINCIRTSHYPPMPVFLELCDELGFYVVDEADLESHGFGKRLGGTGYDPDDIWPCRDPRWRDAFVDRAVRLLQRDKTHTCVIMWSLGNEANYGINFAAMSEYIRKCDTLMGYHRLVHYENAYNYDRENADADTVDVVSRMYKTTDMMYDYVQRTGDKRPIFWCEYSHAMGNGPGDVKDYWDIIWHEPQFIGGCIWEWADHVAPLGEGKYGYGGDFEEETHDGNFCCDGMVFYDRSFKAGSYEIKAVYQGLDTAFEDGFLTLYNRYDFTDFSQYRITWEQVSDDKIVASGTLELNTAPHCKESVKLPLSPVMGIFGTYLNVSMWDAQGREVAHTQHAVDEELSMPEGVGKAAITVDGEYAIIKGEGFTYRFNLHYGYLEALNDYLQSPMKLGVWRAPTDNDRKIKVEWYRERYEKVHNKVYSVQVEDNRIVVRASLAPVSRLPFFIYTATYTFFADSQVDVSLEGNFDTSRTFLPRLGFEFTTKEDTFRYFGYGPLESYVDMHHGSKMGMYESTAEKEYVNYIMPQEHGSHYGTKFLEMGGFAFVSRQGFECNVSKYTTGELEAKQHNFELEADGLTHVRVDYKVSGIGSGSCGPQLLEKYRMQDENVKFEFSIVKL